MRAVAFENNLELTLEIQGEKWHQGDELKGQLKFHNHSDKILNLKDWGVGLAFREIKKVQERNQNQIDFILKESTDVDLKPKQSFEMIFQLFVPHNSSITDKKASPYLYFGDLLKPHNQVQIIIQPHLDNLKILEVLDRFFRFKLKEAKNHKENVTFKLIPPDSRDFANIDHLILTMTKLQSDLIFNFDFMVKKLNVSGISHKVEKSSIQIKQVLPEKAYSLGKLGIDQDKIIKLFESVLAEVELKNVF